MFLLQYLYESCFCVQVVFVNIEEPQGNSNSKLKGITMSEMDISVPFDIVKHLRATEQVINEIELTLLRQL